MLGRHRRACPTAVRIQIAVALIAFLLLSLTQATQKAIASALTFARLVRVNLTHRRRIDRLLGPVAPPQSTQTKWRYS